MKLHKFCEIFNDRQEVKSAIISSVYLFIASAVCISSLPIVNENVPLDVKPLPDLFFASFPLVKDKYDITSMCILILLVSTISIIAIQRRRFVIYRRMAFVMGTLYIYRTVAILITTLPVSEKNLICAQKADWVPSLLLDRLIAQLLGLQNSHLCGSYMMSGHTIMLLSLQLTIQQYNSSEKFHFWIDWGSWVIAYVGIAMILFTHKHYTIDVIVAYIVTTRLFWNYQALCNVKELEAWLKKNSQSKPWWFPIFCKLEHDEILPYQFSLI